LFSQGLVLESEGSLDEAEEWYRQMAIADPSFPGPRRRIAALRVARGKIDEAIEGLCRYVDVYQADGEAWYKLGELYLAQGAVDEAIFAFEESLVEDPASLTRTLALAEARYSRGKKEEGDLHLAKKYFAQAIEISAGTNPRALMGYAATVNRLGTESGDDNSKALGALVSRTLVADYKTNSPALAQVVADFVSASSSV